jgi:lipoate-protein ligase A
MSSFAAGGGERIGTMAHFAALTADAATQMAHDLRLLALTGPAGWSATLRCYGWSPPALSLGRFQSTAAAPALPPGWQLIRRPSGGGAIAHHTGSLTFAMTFAYDAHPWAADPLRLVARINRWWSETFARMGVKTNTPRPLSANSPHAPPYLCFDRQERTDLVAQPLGNHTTFKLLGSAQRRVAHAVLIHGVVLLRRESELASGAIALAELLGRPVSAEEVEHALADTLIQSGWQLTNAALSSI